MSTADSPNELVNEMPAGAAARSLSRKGAGSESSADVPATTERIAAADGRPPVLAPNVANPGEVAGALRELRMFHLRAGGSVEQAALPDGYVPALLHAFRDPSRIREDYPVFLRSGPDEAGRLCVPLADLLEEALRSFAPGADQARVLRDNLLRVERYLRHAVAESGASLLAARPFLVEAMQALQSELGLKGENAEQLEADGGRLLDAIPSDGRFLALREDASLQLIAHASRYHLGERRAAFRETVRGLVEKLREIVEVERNKDPDARNADRLGRRMGGVGAQFVDVGALSRMVGEWRGSAPMSPEERSRIESAIATLDAYLAVPDEGRSVLVLVHDGSIDLESLSTSPDVDLVESSDACAAGAEMFDSAAATLADVVRAVRLARLEIEGRYDASRHATYLAELDWEGFSRDELLLLPAVVTLESADRLAAGDMLSLSRLLLSGRPVHAVVPLRPAQNPGAPSADPFSGFRLELGYLGMGHRNALVHQSSAGRPQHLVAGFREALSATRSSLHVVVSGLDANGRIPRLGPWLHAGAALEGRAHPFFFYNPEAGSTWARRLRFDGNPDPQADWPVYPLTYVDAEGKQESMELAFTFGDFALLDPAYRIHFREVPDGCDDVLVSLDQYLTLNAEDAAQRIPTVWAVDAERHLRRLAVSRRLAYVCRDRLDFWRTLQELAGVRNEYVREAIEKAREETDVAVAAERARLESEHAAELARVREQTAGDAMQALARMLLETDLSAPLAAPSSSGPASATATPTVVPSQAPATEPAAGAPTPEVEEEEGISFDEPYIDTPLCTSCNDCTNINPLLFVYDGNKQARIGDPKAGTFAQLVQAAEKCPAKCIHPGKPLNPDEPNLEALVRRAERFNR